jgi:hypothetical protein
VITVREDLNVGPHVVYNDGKALEHCINELAEKMSEILVLSSVSREQMSFHMAIETMRILQHQLNLANHHLSI